MSAYENIALLFELLLSVFPSMGLGGCDDAAIHKVYMHHANYEIVQQPQHKSRGTKKYRHRLKLKGLATTIVYFSQTCVFTLYRTFTLSLQNHCYGTSDTENKFIRHRNYLYLLINVIMLYLPTIPSSRKNTYISLNDMLFSTTANLDYHRSN